MRGAIYLSLFAWSGAFRSVFNILDYGAIGDGKTLNTAAITRTLVAASKNVPSTVIVPKGVYVTGALQLLSHVYLELQTGAELYASDNASDFLCVPSLTWDTGPCDFPLVYAVNATDIAIMSSSSSSGQATSEESRGRGGRGREGEAEGGAINGGANDPPGHLVGNYDPSTNFLTPVNMPLPGCTPGSCRPKLIVFKYCENIRISGVTIKNSALWTMSFVETRYILVENALISGDRRWPNNDGIDCISCHHLHVTNTVISTGDDCVACIPHTMSGVVNVSVDNCTLMSSSAAIKVSVFDQSASGPTQNMQFTNLLIQNTNRGLCIDPRWGGGNFSNILFANISMQTQFFSSPWWGVGEAISLTVASMSAQQQWNGTVSNISFISITARSENGVVVYSQPELSSKKTSTEASSASAVSWATDISFVNVNLAIVSGLSNYSQPAHDWRPAPDPAIAYAPVDGFFLDGVDSISIINCSVTYVPPMMPYFGECLNATKRVTNSTVAQFRCDKP